MKRILLLFAITTGLLFTSCEGPQGPPGINILGQVFEVNTDFQFNSNTGLYETLINIPTTIEVFESDAILVYRLEKTVTAPDGSSADAWSQIPQNFFLSNGDIIQYVFNHTFFDVEILIDGDYDPALLGFEFTDDQIFRIAIVPSEYASANLTMEELMHNSEFEIIELNNPLK